MPKLGHDICHVDYVIYVDMTKGLDLSKLSVIYLRLLQGRETTVKEFNSASCPLNQVSPQLSV